MSETETESATVEYRVVRSDGKVVPMFWGCDRRGAEVTLQDRERKGEYSPYRIQKRTISEWTDA